MLEFWFDFASTYSYIAAMEIEERCSSAGVALKWRPFLLGPIFALQGWDDSPFNLNALRGAYMWRDLERLTEKYGYPWKKPSAFPRSSTLAARVGALCQDEPWFGVYAKSVFIANFGDDRDIADERVVVDALAAAGQNGLAMLSSAQSPEQRGALRANTSEAIELGIFGAPTCAIDRELFWGEEAIDDAIAWAGKVKADRMLPQE